jgi:4-amino-4-deoxy-L-arabinose transferase-like glycosyltransferase
MTDTPIHNAPARQTLLPMIAILTCVVMAALRAFTAAETLLSPDEAYYWGWTRPLQLSYYDHPGMVAWWIWLGTHLFGGTELGVRMPGLLGALVVSALIWDSGRIVFRSESAGALAALWLNATVLFTAGGMVTTPDSPLLLFWALTLWALLHLIYEGDRRWLYVAALALGLGAISKYTIALILPGIAVTFLLFRTTRPRWLTGHTICAILLGSVCLTPLILWNVQNGGASFKKQLGHAFSADVSHPLADSLVFVGSQIGLITPLLFGLCVYSMGWALWQGWRRDRPDWFLLGATSLPVLLFFLVHTLSGRVQAHWPGPAYLGGIIVSAGPWLAVRSKGWRFTVWAAPALGLLLSIAVCIQAVTQWIPVPARLDPLKRLGGWTALAAKVELLRQGEEGAFLFTAKHEVTGTLSFYLPDHPKVFLLGGEIRPSTYSAADVAALKGKDAIFVTRDKDGDEGTIRPYFEEVVLVSRFPLVWGRQPGDRYAIYVGHVYKGGAFVIGDGWDAKRDAD